MQSDETSCVRTVVEGRKLTLKEPDFLNHPDYGDERSALRQAMGKRIKHLAWIITILCGLCAFAASWHLASKTSNEIGRGAWLPVIIVAGFLVTGATLLALIYWDYRVLKDRARHELEFVRALKAAFQLIAKSLDRLNDRCSDDMSVVREKRLLAVHKVYGGLLSDASQHGVPFLPDFLVRTAVIASAEGMRAKPDVSDIWFAPDPVHAKEWWSPVGLPHLNHGLSESKKLDIEKDRDRYLRPEEGGASEHIRETREPIVVVPGDELHCPQFSTLGVKTCVGIPLIKGDNVIGVMWHRYFAEVEVEKSEIDALVEFGRTVAIACMNVRKRWLAWNKSLREEAVSAVVETYTSELAVAATPK